MELTGNTADRWEQISNKIGEIAASISAKQELIKGVSSTIDELGAELAAERKALELLSNLALKEVLREESGTLNDEDDAVAEPLKMTDNSQSPVKEPTKKASKKDVATQKQAETLPLLEKAESVESDQPLQKEG